jgi:hypothetical protein
MSSWPEEKWTALEDETVPFIGERAFFYFAFATLEAAGGAEGMESFRSRLVATGNDPERPQVTETEQLLIDWGRASVEAPVDTESPLGTRFVRTFSPQLQALLARGVSLATLR